LFALFIGECLIQFIELTTVLPDNIDAAAGTRLNSISNGGWRSLEWR
jgi:hypothetical protein